MRNSLIASLSVAALTLIACGGDGPSGDRAEIADLMVETAAEEDMELDRDCVNDLVAQLSDEDAAALAEAGVDGDAELSEAGDQLGEQIVDCFELSNFIDFMVDSFSGEGDYAGVDPDCLRTAIEDATSVDEVSNQIAAAAFSCSES